MANENLIGTTYVVSTVDWASKVDGDIVIVDGVGYIIGTTAFKSVADMVAAGAIADSETAIVVKNANSDGSAIDLAGYDPSNEPNGSNVTLSGSFSTTAALTGGGGATTYGDAYLTVTGENSSLYIGTYIALISHKYAYDENGNIDNVNGVERARALITVSDGATLNAETFNFRNTTDVIIDNAYVINRSNTNLSGGTMTITGDGTFDTSLGVTSSTGWNIYACFFSMHGLAGYANYVSHTAELHLSEGANFNAISFSAANGTGAVITADNSYLYVQNAATLGASSAKANGKPSSLTLTNGSIYSADTFAFGYGTISVTDSSFAARTSFTVGSFEGQTADDLVITVTGDSTFAATTFDASAGGAYTFNVNITGATTGTKALLDIGTYTSGTTITVSAADGVELLDTYILNAKNIAASNYTLTGALADYNILNTAAGTLLTTKSYDMTSMIMDETWTDKTFGEAIVVGDKTYYFGINAFGTIATATAGVAAASSADSPVTLKVNGDFVATSRFNFTSGNMILETSDVFRFSQMSTTAATTLTIAAGTTITHNGSAWWGSGTTNVYGTFKADEGDTFWRADNATGVMNIYSGGYYALGYFSGMGVTVNVIGDGNAFAETEQFYYLGSGQVFNIGTEASKGGSVNISDYGYARSANELRIGAQATNTGAALTLNNGKFEAKNNSGVYQKITVGYQGKGSLTLTGKSELYAGDIVVNGYGTLSISWDSVLVYTKAMTVNSSAAFSLDMTGFDAAAMGDSKFKYIIDGTAGTTAPVGTYTVNNLSALTDGWGLANVAKGVALVKTDLLSYYGSASLEGEVGDEVVVAGKSYLFGVNAFDDSASALAKAQAASSYDDGKVATVTFADASTTMAVSTTLGQNIAIKTAGTDAVTIGDINVAAGSALEIASGANVEFGNQTGAEDMTIAGTLAVNGKLTADSDSTQSIYLSDGTIAIGATGALDLGGMFLESPFAGTVKVTGNGTEVQDAAQLVVKNDLAVDGSATTKGELIVEKYGSAALTGALNVGTVESVEGGDVVVTDGVLSVGGGVTVGALGTITVTGDSRFSAASLSVNNAAGGLMTVGYGSLISVSGALTVGTNQFVIDFDGFDASKLAGNFHTVVSYGSISGTISTANLEDLTAAGWTYGVNTTTKTAYITGANTKDIYVSTSLAASTAFGSEVVVGDKTYLFGINAFNALNNAAITATTGAYAIAIDMTNASANNLTVAKGANASISTIQGSTTQYTTAKTGNINLTAGSAAAGETPEIRTSATIKAGSDITGGQLITDAYTDLTLEKGANYNSSNNVLFVRDNATFNVNGTLISGTGSVTMDGGQLNIGAEGSLTTANITTFQQGAVNVNGTLNITGTTGINVGSATDKTSTLTVDSGTLTMANTAATLTIGAHATATAASVTLKDGGDFIGGKVIVGNNTASATVAASLSLSNGSSFSATDFTVYAGGSVSLDATSRINITGAYANTIADSFTLDLTGFNGNEDNFAVWVDGSNATGTALAGTVTVSGWDSTLSGWTLVEGTANNSYYAVKTDAFEYSTIVISSDFAAESLGAQVTIGDGVYTVGVNAFASVSGAAGAIAAGGTFLFAKAGNYTIPTLWTYGGTGLSGNYTFDVAQDVTEAVNLVYADATATDQTLFVNDGTLVFAEGSNFGARLRLCTKTADKGITATIDGTVDDTNIPLNGDNNSYVRQDAENAVVTLNISETGKWIAKNVYTGGIINIVGSNGETFNETAQMQASGVLVDQYGESVLNLSKGAYATVGSIEIGKTASSFTTKAAAVSEISLNFGKLETSAIQMYAANAAKITLVNGSELTVSGAVTALSASDVITISSGSTVSVGSYTDVAGATVSQDATSKFVYTGTLTVNGAYTIDLANFDKTQESLVVMLIDGTTSTGGFAGDGAITVANESVLDDSGWTLKKIDDSIFVTKADTTTLALNAAWDGFKTGTKVTLNGVDYVFGINAFSTWDSTVIAANANDASTLAVAAGSYTLGATALDKNLTISTVGAATLTGTDGLVTAKDFTVTAGSVFTAEKFQFSGGTVTVNGALVATTDFSVVNGELVIGATGSVTSQYTLTLKTATTISGNGAAFGTTQLLSGAATVIDATTLTVNNYGSISGKLQIGSDMLEGVSIVTLDTGKFYGTSLNIGNTDNQAGTLNLTGKSEVVVKGDIVNANNGTVNQLWTSTVSYTGSFTNNGSYTISLTDITEEAMGDKLVYKLIDSSEDLTGKVNVVGALAGWSVKYHHGVYLQKDTVSTDTVAVYAAWSKSAYGTTVTYNGQSYVVGVNAFGTWAKAYDATDATKINVYNAPESGSNFVVNRDMAIGGGGTLTATTLRISEKSEGVAATVTINEGDSVQVAGNVMVGYNSGNTQGKLVISGKADFGQMQLRPFGEVTVTETGAYVQTIGGADTNMFNGAMTITGTAERREAEDASLKLKTFLIYDNLGKGANYVTSITSAYATVDGSMLFGYFGFEKSVSTSGFQQGNLSLVLDSATFYQSVNASGENGIVLGQQKETLPAEVKMFGGYGNVGEGTSSNTSITLKNGSQFNADGYIVIGSSKTYTDGASNEYTTQHAINIDTNSTLSYKGGLYIYGATTTVGEGDEAVTTYEGGKINITVNMADVAEGTKLLQFVDSGKEVGKGLVVQTSAGVAIDPNYAVTVSGLAEGWASGIYHGGVFAYDKSAYDVSTVVVDSAYKTVGGGSTVTVNGTDYLVGVNAFTTFAEADAVKGVNKIIVNVTDGALLDNITSISGTISGGKLNEGAFALTVGRNEDKNPYPAEGVPDTYKYPVVTIDAGETLTTTGITLIGFDYNPTGDTLTHVSQSADVIVSGTLDVNSTNLQSRGTITVTETGKYIDHAQSDWMLCSGNVIITGDGTFSYNSAELRSVCSWIDYTDWTDAQKEAGYACGYSVTDAKVYQTTETVLGRFEAKDTDATHPKETYIRLNNSQWTTDHNDLTFSNTFSLGADETLMPSDAKYNIEYASPVGLDYDVLFDLKNNSIFSTNGYLVLGETAKVTLDATSQIVVKMGYYNASTNGTTNIDLTGFDTAAQTKNAFVFINTDVEKLADIKSVIITVTWNDADGADTKSVLGSDWTVATVNGKVLAGKKTDSFVFVSSSSEVTGANVYNWDAFSEFDAALNVVTAGFASTEHKTFTYGTATIAGVSDDTTRDLGGQVLKFTGTQLNLTGDLDYKNGTIAVIGGKLNINGTDGASGVLTVAADAKFVVSDGGTVKVNEIYNSGSLFTYLGSTYVVTAGVDNSTGTISVVVDPEAPPADGVYMLFNGTSGAGTYDYGTTKFVDASGTQITITGMDFGTYNNSLYAIKGELTNVSLDSAYVSAQVTADISSSLIYGYNAFGAANAASLTDAYTITVGNYASDLVLGAADPTFETFIVTVNSDTSMKNLTTGAGDMVQLTIDLDGIQEGTALFTVTESGIFGDESSIIKFANANQVSTGSYTLISGLTAFTKSIQLTDTLDISLESGTVTYDGKKYTLSLTDGALKLEVTDFSGDISVNPDWNSNINGFALVTDGQTVAGSQPMQFDGAEANVFNTITAAQAAMSATSKLYLFKMASGFASTAYSMTNIQYIGAGSEMDADQMQAGDSLKTQTSEYVRDSLGETVSIGLNKDGKAVSVNGITGFATVNVTDGASVNDIRMGKYEWYRATTDDGVTIQKAYTGAGTLTVSNASIGTATGVGSATLTNATWTKIYGGKLVSTELEGTADDFYVYQLLDGTLNITGSTTDGSDEVLGFQHYNISNSSIGTVKAWGDYAMATHLRADVTVNGTVSIEKLSLANSDATVSAGATLTVGSIDVETTAWEALGNCTITNNGSIAFAANGSLNIAGPKADINSASMLTVSSALFNSAFVSDNLVFVTVDGTLKITGDVSLSDLNTFAAKADSNVNRIVIDGNLTAEAGSTLTLGTADGKISKLEISGGITATDTVNVEVATGTELLIGDLTNVNVSDFAGKLTLSTGASWSTISDLVSSASNGAELLIGGNLDNPVSTLNLNATAGLASLKVLGSADGLSEVNLANGASFSVNRINGDLTVNSEGEGNTFQVLYNPTDGWNYLSITSGTVIFNAEVVVVSPSRYDVTENYPAAIAITGDSGVIFASGLDMSDSSQPMFSVADSATAILSEKIVTQQITISGGATVNMTSTAVLNGANLNFSGAADKSQSLDLAEGADVKFAYIDASSNAAATVTGDFSYIGIITDSSSTLTITANSFKSIFSTEENASSMSVRGTLLVTGAIKASEIVTVMGSITGEGTVLKNLVLDNLTIDGDLAALSAISKIAVVGDISVTAKGTVGTMTVSGDAAVNANLSVKNLSVADDVTINGAVFTIENQGAASADELILTGDATVIGTTFTVRALTVSGTDTAAVLSSDKTLALSKGADTAFVVAADTSLTLTGAQLAILAAANTVTVDGMLHVTGVIDQTLVDQFEGHISIDGTLEDVGSVTIKDGESKTIVAARVTGSDANDTIKIGKNASFTITGEYDMLGGKNAITVGANSSFTVAELLNASSITLTAGAAYKNEDGVKVQGWTTMSATKGITMAAGDTKISIGNYATLTAGANAISASDLGGSVTISAGTASTVTAGSLSDIKSLTIGNGGKYVDETTQAEVFGRAGLTLSNGGITGLNTNSTVKIGTNADANIAGDINLLGGTNTVSVGANSTLTAQNMAGVSKLTITNGAAEKNSEGVSIQKYTEVTLSGNFVAPAMNNTISIGKFNKVSIAGSISNASSGATGTTVSVGANSTFSVAGIQGLAGLTGSAGAVYTSNNTKTQGMTQITVNGSITGTAATNKVTFGSFTTASVDGNIDLLGGSNTLTLAAKSTLGVTGDIVNVKTLSLSAGGVYANLAGTKVIGAAEMTVGGDYTGIADKNAVTLGNFAVLTIAGSIAQSSLGGSYDVKVGANASLGVTGGISGLNSLTVSNGSTYTIVDKVQGVSQAIINGSVTGTNAVNKVSVGSFSEVVIGGDLDLKSGANTVSVGAKSSMVVDGDIKGIKTTTLSNGVADAWTTLEAASLNGTSADDKVSIGSYAELAVDDLDLGEGAKDTLAIGANGWFRANGDVSGVEIVTLGKNGLAEASTAAAATLAGALATKGSKMDATAKIVDIGSTLEIASAFTGLETETADNTYASTASLEDGTNGWLSSKNASVANVSTYSDTVDFFQLDGVTDSLSGWQITGEAGSLVVQVWKDETTATLIEGVNGVWDLSAAEITGSTYRISVEIADGKEDIYSYKAAKLA